MQEFFNKLEAFFSFPLYTGLIFALPIYFCAMLYGVEFAVEFFLLSYVVGVAIYSFNRGTDVKEDLLNRHQQNKKAFLCFIVISVLCYVLAVIFGLLDGGFKLVLVLSFPLIMGFFYSKKVGPLPRFKEVLGIKNFVAAFCIAFLGSFMASFMGAVEFGVVVLAFLYVFVQVFIDTVIFDIFDMAGDMRANVITLPLRFGKQKITRFLLLLNSLLLFWFGFCFISGLFTAKYLFIAGFGIFYTYVCIWYFVKCTNKRFLAEIFVDGLWIILAILMWLL